MSLHCCQAEGCLASQDILERLHETLTCGNEVMFKKLLESLTVDTVKECMSSDRSIFIKVCAQGLLSSALFLLNTCAIDLSAELDGRTALQWACLRGHADIVKTLLPLHKQESPRLATPSWKENSEFFSASVGGHTDIVTLLTDYFPDDLNDVDIIQSLLYAACVGGHAPSVRKWLLPSLNVNEPLRLVSQLHDCENRTPFQAACEGSHRAVAKLLMEESEAEVTEQLANQFPDFTGDLVQVIHQPLHVNEKEVKYALWRSGIHCIHPTWMRPHLSALTHIDISENNCLKQLNACIPWAVQNLVHLNISNNQLQRLLPPESSENILCQSLEVVDASNNSITEVCIHLFQLPSLLRLNLSHNKLHRLSKLPSFPVLVTATKRPTWCCSNLVNLNLSHNQLDIVPDDIKNCVSLTHLDLSHNCLCSLPSPWECPLEYLNVSANCIDRFPPSTEQYWKSSLTHLFLNNNQLDQLEESVLKLGTLQKLDASNNKIQYLAPAHVWDFPSLEDLNLSHNSLGRTQQINRKNSARVIEFPSQLLSENLRSLNISHNDLIQVPLSVCFIKNLAILDISHNPMKDFPEELGNLRHCWDLKISGLEMQNPQLQEILNSKRPIDAIEYQRKKLRKVQPYFIVKALVIGPQNKGKSTVIESLVRGSPRDIKSSDQHVTVTTHVIKPPGRFWVTENPKPDVTLRIWELAGNPEILALHPVMWSENCLFLLVWDLTDATAGLSQWLYNIKSRLEKVGVIIVATFKDRIDGDKVEGRLQQFHAEISALYGVSEYGVGVYPKEDRQRIFPCLHDVVFVTRHMYKQDVRDLRTAVYSATLKLVRGVQSAKFVMGELLPQSYIAMDRKLIETAKKFRNTERPPYLRQAELDELIRTEPLADFHTFDDQQIVDGSERSALQTWKQLGSVLHFDVWAEGLSQLYFLDPNWLAAMIAAVLMPAGVSAAYRQSTKDVFMRLSNLGFPSDIFKPFLQLLKHFDIGAVLDDQDSLLLPCLLPKAAPGLELSCSTSGRILRRFYAMPYIPSPLWARLILEFLMSTERFAESWQGNKMKKPHLTYWQEGLMMKHSGGSIIIESVLFVAEEGERQQYCGILISILTDSSTLADLAVIGFVTDVVDSALLNIFPHYNDNSELFGIYAMCPVCYDGMQACDGIIKGKGLHFPLADCAGHLLQGHFSLCPYGSMVALEDLIPEFLMGELPKRFVLKGEEVQLGERLGGGAAGTVYKGILRETEVAVKVFYQGNSIPHESTDNVSDSGLSTLSSTGSAPGVSDTVCLGSTRPVYYGNFREVSEQLELRRQDYTDSRNLKICRAFSELRQEIGILSQLRHPCLVSLLGVSVSPSLLVVLELAPFGSLQSVLDKHVKNRPFNKYRNKDQTFSTLLEKYITFKIVYQIGLGLKYLHDLKILYRDLKSQNILVCSMDTEDTVNIKISDYGISRFITSQGLMGKVGTPGYMAPEIMDGQAYDVKVDIFSFSMVIYELLTGHPPFEKYGRLHQIHQLISTEKCRPSLMDFNIISNFPYLEALMEKMWAHDPCDRPSASTVVHQMEDVGFVLQHSYLESVAEEQSPETGAARSRSGSVTAKLFSNVTCVWAFKETQRATSVTGRNNCLIWESPSDNIEDRRLSIYNLAPGKLQNPTRKKSPGPPVICMARIGKHIWVGCQGGKIEIFASSCADLTKGKSLLDTLDADPVTILHDKLNPKKEKLDIGSEGFVYIAVSNGSIQIYGHNRRNTTLHNRSRSETSVWHRHKTLKEITTSSIQAMSLVPSKEQLLIGCGHSIVIVNTATLQLDRRICLLKDLPPSMRGNAECLNVMVSNDSSLWCSFRQSPLIMEIELSSLTVSGAYCIEADLEVYITEVRLDLKAIEDSLCYKCHGVSSVVCGQLHGASSRRDGSQTGDDFKPPCPPRSTKPSVLAIQTCNQSEMPRVEQEVDVRSKPQVSDCKDTVDYEKGSGIYDSIVLQSVTQPENIDMNHGESSLETEKMTMAESSEPPPLPLRRPLSHQPSAVLDVFTPLSKAQSMTMSNLSTYRNISPPTPTQQPSRRSLPSEHDGVHVQSLLSVNDTLWVGSSCGEILVIGVQKRDPVYQGQERGDGNPVSHNACHCPNLSRISLSLESKQMCNLKSVKMSEDDRIIGGVQTLIQARNLVVAVCDVSQTENNSDIAEISVWEAFTAEKILSVRNYWKTLGTFSVSCDEVR